jgi:hypothetical protein
MVRRAYSQGSLVEVLLPDGDKLWDPTLRQIDTTFDYDTLVDLVAAALARPHPLSQRRGRLGTPAAVVPLHACPHAPLAMELRGARAGSPGQPRLPSVLSDRRRTGPRCQDAHSRGPAVQRARAQAGPGASGPRGPAAAGRSRAPHAEAIRKRQAVKPTEFGKLVKIQETEAQLITDYAVCATRVPDDTRWEPCLVRHEELFGRPPRLAVADAGFASAADVEIARPGPRSTPGTCSRTPRGPPCPPSPAPPPGPRSGCARLGPLSLPAP